MELYSEDHEVGHEGSWRRKHKIKEWSLELGTRQFWWLLACPYLLCCQLEIRRHWSTSVSAPLCVTGHSGLCISALKCLLIPPLLASQVPFPILSCFRHSLLSPLLLGRSVMCSPYCTKETILTANLAKWKEAFRGGPWPLG